MTGSKTKEGCKTHGEMDLSVDVSRAAVIEDVVTQLMYIEMLSLSYCFGDRL